MEAGIAKAPDSARTRVRIETLRWKPVKICKLILGDAGRTDRVKFEYKLSNGTV